MTEQEAKQKLCPHFLDIATTTAMAAYKNGALEENDVGLSITGGSRCVASDCMMWRIDGLDENDIGEIVDRGYCGLAGKP